MSFLLDTHAVLWFFAGSDELSPFGRKTIEGHKGLHVSIVSLWEIAIKANLGRLNLDVPFKDFPQALSSLNIQVLPITFEDTATYLTLPLHHRDPFDRMIAAQAMNHSLVLLSRDQAFEAYDLQCRWDGSES